MGGLERNLSLAQLLVLQVQLDLVHLQLVYQPVQIGNWYVRQILAPFGQGRLGPLPQGAWFRPRLGGFLAAGHDKRLLSGIPFGLRRDADAVATRQLGRHRGAMVKSRQGMEANFATIMIG
jgi:hypothetical protein